MKYTLALLSTLLCSGAQAQTIHRCDAGAGTIAYQDRPCQVVAALDANMPVATDVMVLGGAFEDPIYAQREHEYRALEVQQRQQRRQWRQGAKLKNQAESARVQGLLQSLSDTKAAKYAESRDRCESAMQVAALCGKYAGMFSCNDKGFRRSISTVSTPAAAFTGNGNGAAFNVEQCALQASKGR